LKTVITRILKLCVWLPSCQEFGESVMQVLTETVAAAGDAFHELFRYCRDSLYLTVSEEWVVNISSFLLTTSVCGEGVS
jgi:hypothetical protein